MHQPVTVLSPPSPTHTHTHTYNTLVLTLRHTMHTFNYLEKEKKKKKKKSIVGKGVNAGKCLYQHFFLFPTMFSTLLKSNLNFLPMLYDRAYSLNILLKI